MRDLRIVLIFVLYCLLSFSALQAQTLCSFDFGSGPAEDGFTAVTASTLYADGRGYGFEPGYEPVDVFRKTGTALTCDFFTHAYPVLFSVKLPEGNYKVTLTLGDTEGVSRNTVKSEVRRLMLEGVETGRGEVRKVSFNVNVRTPQLSKGNTVKLNSREMDYGTGRVKTYTWDDKLTLQFHDSALAVCALEVEKAAEDVVTVFIIGDSTVTDQAGGGTWGQYLPRWFDDRVVVSNHAESGMTIKGFRFGRRWDKVLESARPGDYLLIQLGTNDEKSRGHDPMWDDADRAGDWIRTHSDPGTDYVWGLATMALEARRHGIIPVIVSPMTKIDRGTATSTDLMTPYGINARRGAELAGCAFIDLWSASRSIVSALGQDALAAYSDGTHTDNYGAYLFSQVIVQGMRDNGLGLVDYLLPDAPHFDAEAPKPLLKDFACPVEPPQNQSVRQPVPPGSSRKGDAPVLFLVGDSTMRNGVLGNGNNGQWGWGNFIGEWFDESRITVENQAMGGLSSRTFWRDRWPGVLEGIRKGDYVIIQIGHNDSGPIDEGRARNSLPGTGKEKRTVTIKETGVTETVYTYGEYVRRMARDVIRKGAHPIIMSLTPRPFWNEEGRLERKSGSFTAWAREVAAGLKIPFIDLEDSTASRFEGYGPEKTSWMYYGDSIHSSEYGARENARSAVEGIAASRGSDLRKYLLPAKMPVLDFMREDGKPVVFFIGDSTMKNEDSGPDSMWGWGSVADSIFDTGKITLVNAGMAGRSARTFLEEGRWERVYNSLRPGDYVVIQFGHNDIGDIFSGKARGELPGDTDESQVGQMASDGRYKVVYSYGWYLRRFILEAREKGAVPILVSLTPRNEWTGSRIERRNDTYGEWLRSVVERTEADFVDMHNITADYFNSIGREATAPYYKNDHTHTSRDGALRNAESVAEGLRRTGHPLAAYLRAR